MQKGDWLGSPARDPEKGMPPSQVLGRDSTHWPMLNLTVLLYCTVRNRMVVWHMVFILIRVRSAERHFIYFLASFSLNFSPLSASA